MLIKKKKSQHGSFFAENEGHFSDLDPVTLPSVLTLMVQGGGRCEQGMRLV